jgi:hypothetical protein
VVEEDFGNNYEYEDEEDFPPDIRDKFSAIPRNIGMLEKFYNPHPQDEWEDERRETVLHKRAVKIQEASFIATVYDGSPEPKKYKEAKQCKFPPNWC